MNFDLPRVRRSLLGGGVIDRIGVWLPFEVAAAELAEIYPEADPRGIEQSLFDGVPIMDQGVIYVPENVLASLLESAQ